jgi:hypothetical protein
VPRTQLLLTHLQYPLDQVIEQNVSNGSIRFNSFNARTCRTSEASTLLVLSPRQRESGV